MAKNRKAFTPEEQEKQCVNDAMLLAHKQIKDGTASSAVICHFLKLGTEQAKAQTELVQAQAELAEAKAENVKAQTQLGETIEAAMAAMKAYGNFGGSDEEDVD